MIVLLSLLLCLAFAVLAGIHFYWAVGGNWGFDKALPTNEQEERVLNPKKFDCVIVGIGLTVFGLYYLIKLQWIGVELPYWLSISTGWGIPAIFVMRAVGDFKFVGFFKKVRNTEFGKYDSKFFSPLCLVIALIGVVINIG